MVVVHLDFGIFELILSCIPQQIQLQAIYQTNTLELNLQRSDLQYILVGIYFFHLVIPQKIVAKDIQGFVNQPHSNLIHSHFPN